jgi:tetratricopeptide (TPR) repeat protein
VAAEPEPVLLEPDVMDEEFDVETPAAGGRPRVTFRDIVEESPAAADEGAPAGAAAPPPAAPAPPEPELSSPTLAELYFDQGFFEKAIDVYRRLLQRDPGNDRLRVRLGEIEAIQRGAAGVVAAAAGSREEAIGRAIARLQGLRAALARRS